MKMMKNDIMKVLVSTTTYQRAYCAAWNIRAKALKHVVDKGWTDRKEVMPAVIEIHYVEN